MSELKTLPPTQIERKVNGATAGAALSSTIVAAVMSWLPESASEIAGDVSRIVEWLIGGGFIAISTFIGGYVTRSKSDG